ncbi:hypothetical protein J2Z42_001665 [Clostridium algifaecis]|uniref:SPOR domain-containing protein n=1 Tax=Clostridium algifaecis TaxID=1472040 RepID=A0ABS4KSH1_9CLOT|nr:hypothetical protein [Clostridium algifaecis]MBP2032986.1 hypothetical protein [Clostridium algifaecis]
MKYTRYDLKKKTGTKSFVIIITLIFITAFIIGTFAFKILMSNYGGNAIKTDMSADKTEDSYNKKSAIDGSETKFIAVQGGIYKDNNNVDEEKKLLSSYGVPFEIKDGDKVRVFLGIYTEAGAKDIVSSLTKQKVDNSNMNFSIKKDSLCNAEIIEIINANLQILNKFSEKDVESIKTDELKKWCASLKDVNKSDKNYYVFKDLRDYINKFPDKLPKDKIDENYIYIYGKLKNMN